MPLKIAVIGHIRHAIEEPFMGGMEAHCASLVAGLEDAGHAVTLFAAPGSCAGNIVEICPAPYEDVLPWDRFHGTPSLERYQQLAFGQAWDVIRARNFDVVHNNSLFPPLIDRALEDGVPMVASQHVPPFGAMRAAVWRAAGSGSVQVTVPSRSQLPLWFDSPPDNLRVVYNGIDCAKWDCGAEHGDALVWFGRITPNKGLYEAVMAARAAGARLDIYGTIEEQTYFSERVRPFLDDTIRYRGHLSGERLRSAVCAARAVLVTPMWDEPFGLVAAEALAGSVPVIAFDRGAMREVVGDCGIIVPPGDIAALGKAIGAIDAIDPSRCRTRAVENFSLTAMIAGYEACYESAMEYAASASSLSRTHALLA